VDGGDVAVIASGVNLDMDLVVEAVAKRASLHPVAVHGVVHLIAEELDRVGVVLTLLPKEAVGHPLYIGTEDPHG